MKQAQPAAMALLPSAMLEQAVNSGIAAYIASRREKIRPFCQQHYAWPGAARLNRRAWGHDLWRTPVNLLWAVPYLLGRSAAALAHVAGLRGGERWLKKLPPGVPTAVQREIEWLIFTEFLELPIQQSGRCTERDALLEYILVQPPIESALVGELQHIDELAQRADYRQKVAAFFETYVESRAAAADLTTSLLNLAAGAAAFHKFTPGAAALGQAAAAAIAQQLAISGFALGPVLGSLYYSLFPAAVSAGLLVGVIGTLMVALGVFAALAGFITDPLQQALGLHERKLRKLLDALERSLRGGGGDYRLHDAYVARVFDVLDVVRTVSRKLG